MCTINEVNTAIEKAEIIERSLKLAYKAHDMSYELISDQTKDRLVAFVIAKAYAMNEEKIQENENTPPLRL